MPSIGSSVQNPENQVDVSARDGEEGNKIRTSGASAIVVASIYDIHDLLCALRVARAQSPCALLSGLQRCCDRLVRELDNTVAQFCTRLGSHVSCVFFTDDAIVWERMAEDGVDHRLC